MSTTVYMKKGDRLPKLEATLQLDSGDPVSLVGATVRFRMAESPTATAKVDAAATVVSAAAGTVEYEWGATDTDTAGTYLAEWEVTIGGLTQTVPSRDFLRIVIVDDLA